MEGRQAGFQEWGVQGGLEERSQWTEEGRHPKRTAAATAMAGQSQPAGFSEHRTKDLGRSAVEELLWPCSKWEVLADFRQERNMAR